MLVPRIRSESRTIENLRLSIEKPRWL
jgi:hypothetical protein